MLVELVDHGQRSPQQVFKASPPVLKKVLDRGDDGVNTTVAVGEQVGVHQVDARHPVVPPEIQQPDLMRNGLRDHLQSVAHQVSMGVNDHDGAIVLSLSLALQLMVQNVFDHGGLAHARPAHNDSVLPYSRFGQPDVLVGQG